MTKHIKLKDDLLPKMEQEAIDINGELARSMRKIIGDGPNAYHDWTEVTVRIHALQLKIFSTVFVRFDIALSSNILSTSTKGGQYKKLTSIGPIVLDFRLASPRNTGLLSVWCFRIPIRKEIFWIKPCHFFKNFHISK